MTASKHCVAEDSRVVPSHVEDQSVCVCRAQVTESVVAEVFENVNTTSLRPSSNVPLDSRKDLSE